MFGADVVYLFMVTALATVGSSDLPPFFSQPRATGLLCTSFEKLENGLVFPTHRQTTPDEWFYEVWKPHLNSAALCHKVRCNGASDATWLHYLHNIPPIARKHSWNKLFMTYGVFKENCKSKGMDGEDVLALFMLVIDLDGIATLKDVAIIAAAFPDCAIIKSTGIQIFMRFAGDYETAIRMLSALATLAVKLCPHLRYDKKCHFRDDGSVANHINHAYRLPWGSCKSDGKEKVLSFLPKSGKIADVCNIFNMHKLEMPPLVVTKDDTLDIKDVAQNPLPTVQKSVPRKKTFSGSEGIKHQEYDVIRQTLTDCILAGMSRTAAENEVASMKWTYHREAYLRRTLHKASLKSAEKSKLPASVAAAIRADMKEINFRLGPTSNKRTWCQKTFTLAAHRAWSFEFLFYQPDITMEEAIAAFFYRAEFKKVRTMSIAAIGEAAVRKDLENLWNKYFHPDLSDNPYVNFQPVSRATLALVLRKARLLGKFKMAVINSLLALSEQQTRAALAVLCAEGKITKDGNNNGRVYRVVQEEKIEEEGYDYRVPAICGSNMCSSIRSGCSGLDNEPTKHDFSPQTRFTEPIKRKIRPPALLRI